MTIVAKKKLAQKKCNSCGGHFKFDPTTCSLICSSCGKKIEIKKSNIILKHNLDSNIENTIEYEKWTKSQKIFNCSECGAQILMNKYDMTAKCPYCHSPYITLTDNLPSLKPDGIIPFAFDVSDASLKFSKNVRKKFFVPSKFKKSMPESEIKAFYIPSFSCDADIKSKYEGLLAIDEVHTDSEGHAHTSTIFQNIGGEYKTSFKDIIVESSTKISQQDLSFILPYDYSSLYTFNDNFVVGYSLEYYNTKIDDCKKIANSIMDSYTETQILNQYTYTRLISYKQKTSFLNEKFCYNILPIYKFDFKYAKKDYSVLMNGQTSKLGKGLPLSKFKIALVVILLAIIAIAIGYLVLTTGELPE